ncbi:tetratricopeptide repeat protein [Acidobacteriia bacterium AH_259_A11_L15]|nr:tetratricopeptide repeat protein [Acidobacteriia bacterium AH_259_A11_L15]
MRRDLLVTALVFMVVGFVAGWVYTRQTAPPLPRQPPPTSAETDLPEGHPPLDVAGRWRALQEQAEADPDNPLAAIDLGNFLYDLGRWDQAILWYQHALELDSSNTDVRTDLGVCYFNLGRFDEALAEFDRVLEIEPDKPQALFNLAITRLRGKQDQAGARRAYERLRRAHPDYEGLEGLAQLLEGEPSPP